MPLAPDTRPRWSRITLRTDCPRCGANLPVNGPADAVACAECGHVQPVDGALFRWLFDAAEGAFPEPLRSTRSDGDLTWRATAEPFAAPPCLACDGVLTLGEGAAVCGSCGASAVRSPPPRSVGRAVDGVMVPLGDGGDGAAEGPVALNCPSCGAGLSVDAAAPRLSTCDHCGSQVHLPELVWRRFHPKRTVMPWAVVFEREHPGVAKARQRREDDEKKRAREAREEEDRRRRLAEQAARDRERAAEQAAKDAAAAAEKADADRRWALLTAPLVVVSLLLALSAVGAMLGAAGVDVAHALTPRWKPWRQLGLAAEVAPELVAAYGLGVWFVCLVLAAIRGRAGAAVVLVGAVFLVMMHIPFIGPFFGWWQAWEHLRDREPTLEADARVPFLTGLPLAIVYATLPLYDSLLFVFLID